MWNLYGRDIVTSSGEAAKSVLTSVEWPILSIVVAANNHRPGALSATSLSPPS